MARKNYRSHIIRAKGWKNECVGYHIKGDIFNAATPDVGVKLDIFSPCGESKLTIQIEQCCLM